MTIQGLITPDQLLLHGSAQPPHESVDLGAMVHDIEAALREDHLPELLELVGEEGYSYAPPHPHPLQYMCSFAPPLTLCREIFVCM